MQENLPIQIAVAKDTQVPSYAHAGDSGMDLYATETVTLEAGQRALIGTGIKVAIPSGYEAQVRPKSGLAIKHGITVLNTPGTIDAPYRGEIKIPLINLGQESYQVEQGKKIAQIVFAKVTHATFEVVEELDQTTRGEGGFGSTGL